MENRPISADPEGRQLVALVREEYAKVADQLAVDANELAHAVMTRINPGYAPPPLACETVEAVTNSLLREAFDQYTASGEIGRAVGNGLIDTELPRILIMRGLAEGGVRMIVRQICAYPDKEPVETWNGEAPVYADLAARYPVERAGKTVYVLLSYLTREELRRLIDQ